MAQDFIELFRHLYSDEVNEKTLYEFIEDADNLIRSGIRNSVPNTLRKFYECILCRYGEVTINAQMSYSDEDSRVNIGETSKRIFKHRYHDFYKGTVIPFIKAVNSGSHYNGVEYAPVSNSDLRKYIGYIIDIWNWYAKEVRELDKKYLVTKSYGLPKSDREEFSNMKNKYEAQTEKIQKLQEENQKIKDAQESIIDMNMLCDDIYSTIIMFNEEHLYCTHKTVAMFLMGNRIAQTDFANLSKFELFGKYSVNRFTALAYDFALEQLIQQEKILHTGMYFVPFDNNAGILTKWIIKLKTKLNLFRINKREYKLNINERYVKIIQEAIEENKNIQIKYCKQIPNTGKKEISKKILIPKILLPKDKMNEEYDEQNPPRYTQNLYYLRAFDTEKNETRTYRLDNIKRIKKLK